MITKNNVDLYLQIYDAVYEKVSSLVELQGKIDDVYYTINSFESSNGYIMVNADYYRCGWTDWCNLTFEVDLLYDIKLFEDFEKEANEIKNKREEFNLRKELINQKEKELAELKRL